MRLNRRIRAIVRALCNLTIVAFCIMIVVSVGSLKMSLVAIALSLLLLRLVDIGSRRK